MFLAGFILGAFVGALFSFLALALFRADTNRDGHTH
jgi:hypothetical protein